MYVEGDCCESNVKYLILISNGEIDFKFIIEFSCWKSNVEFWYRISCTECEMFRTSTWLKKLSYTRCRMLNIEITWFQLI